MTLMRTHVALMLACVSLLAISTAASAQDAPRAYDNGPVWDIQSIQTKPGHFDDYMRFVATTWRAQEEALKKQGAVLDYKVYNVVDPRDNEPDIFLAVEYKDMATYDAPLDAQDALMKKVYGSTSEASKKMADRDTIRTVRGDLLTRELILK
jgi:hypothetical protein